MDVEFIQLGEVEGLTIPVGNIAGRLYEQSSSQGFDAANLVQIGVGENEGIWHSSYSKIYPRGTNWDILFTITSSDNLRIPLMDFLNSSGYERVPNRDVFGLDAFVGPSEVLFLVDQSGSALICSQNKLDKKTVCRRELLSGKFLIEYSVNFKNAESIKEIDKEIVLLMSSWAQVP